MKEYVFNYNEKTGELVVTREDGKEVKQHTHNGYWRMRLNEKKEFVHVIIARLFVEEYFEGCVVHHKNGDKKDNRIENLQCLTNEDHSRLHSTGKKHTEEAKNKISKAREKKVVFVKKETRELIKEYKSARKANEETGIDYRYISRYCRGERKQKGECIWMFAEDYYGGETE